MIQTRDRMASEIKQIVYEGPRDIIYYKLQYTGLEFQVVTGILWGKQHYVILDSSGNECMSVYIDEDNTLLLSYLKYRPTCSITHDMSSGESTIHMIKGLLKFVMEKEPKYNSIHFEDISTFDCILPGKNNTIQISLPFFNFVVYGKTWYERHFQAEITYELLKTDMLTSLSKLNATIENTTLYTKLLSETLKRINRSKFTSYKTLGTIVNECFESALAAKSKWIDLFHTLFTKNGSVSKALGANYSCALFYSIDDLFYEFNVPNFRRIPMKLTREIISSYPGTLDIKEDKEPIHIYRGGNTLDMLSYPYYREYGKGTRRVKHILPLEPYISLPRYFKNLRRTRKNKKSKIHKRKSLGDYYANPN